jgi:molybdenum-dependent DNA-binding transcriptional regulator ModE
MIDADAARNKILKALRECGGNARLAAEQLECSYTTLWRIINDDKSLHSSVVRLRKRLGREGWSQRGWPGK